MTKTNFNKVREFHKAFNIECPTTPTFISEDLEKLRLRLIDEEVAELKEGLAARDMENVAKELADIIYVVYGFADALGIDLDAAFAEVHKSNMSKLGEDGKPVFREDGKILKGPNYFKADMSKIWDGFGENTIVITEKDFDSYFQSYRILNALEAGGVDNWEWYSESLRNAGFYDDEEEEEDY